MCPGADRRPAAGTPVLGHLHGRGGNRGWFGFVWALFAPVGLIRAGGAELYSRVLVLADSDPGPGSEKPMGQLKG